MLANELCTILNLEFSMRRAQQVLRDTPHLENKKMKCVPALNARQNKTVSNKPRSMSHGSLTTGITLFFLIKNFIWMAQMNLRIADMIYERMKSFFLIVKVMGSF